MRSYALRDAALLSIALLLGGYSAARPCLDACEENRGFWETCMAEDGTLCDGTVTADCVDDPERYAACAEQDFDGDGCDYDTLVEEGVLHTCTSPSDAVSSCEDVVRERFRSYDDDEKTNEAEECAAGPEEDDLIGNAIANEDCSALCDAF